MYFLKKCSGLFLLVLFIFNLCGNFSVTAQENEEGHDEVYQVDFVLSVGPACRPSIYIKEYDLRFQAAPLDWMMKYDLSKVIHFFKTGFNDFFEEIEEIPEKFCGNCKFVKDTKNGVISIHHFDKDNSLDSEHKKFRETMLRRAKSVDEILKKSNSIALVCNRPDVAMSELLNFAKDFSDIYKDKKIILINVVDMDTEKIHKSILFEYDNLKVVQFIFSDKPPIDDPQKFPKWRGNPIGWKAVMKKIKLNKSSCSANSISASYFD